MKELNHVQRNPKVYAIGIAIVLGITFLAASKLLVPLVVKEVLTAAEAATSR